MVERKTVRKSLLKLALTCLGSYGAILLMLLWFQSKMLYHPSRSMESPGRDLTVQDVWMTSTNGTRIHGWWILHPQATKTLLFCHGNAGNLSHRIGMIREWHRRFHMNVMIFDYQGYGRSEGSPTEQGTYDDARAAWDYIRHVQQIKPQQIVILGRSLGGSIAAQLATQVKPAALILDSPFSSFVDVAQAHFSWLPVRWIARFRYTTTAYLKQRTCPLLVIHSPDDEVIPITLGRRCFEQAPEPKHFLQIQGNHNDGFYISMSAYFQGVQAFFQRHIR